MNKTKKGLRKRIRFQGAGNVQVNCTGSHARENASLSLYVVSTRMGPKYCILLCKWRRACLTSRHFGAISCLQAWCL